MKILFFLVWSACASLSIASAMESDSLKLLGLSEPELAARFGSPPKVLGPTGGCRTFVYPRGMQVAVHDGHVVQYVADGESNFQTDKGIRIGSTLEDVVSKYGNYTAEETSPEWFSGNKQKVLYHHEGFGQYKINYADDDLIFFFGPNKKVNVIWVGYIFPRE